MLYCCTSEKRNIYVDLRHTLHILSFPPIVVTTDLDSYPYFSYLSIIILSVHTVNMVHMQPALLFVYPRVWYNFTGVAKQKFSCTIAEPGELRLQY